MTNKKIGLGMLAAAAVLALFASACKTFTTAPIFYSNNTHYDFIILGEVIYESPTAAGFQNLLNAARAQYPQCDYVIDVMVDSQTTTTVFFRMRKTFTIYTMRGTAIQYIYKNSDGQTIARPAPNPATPAQSSAGAGTAASTGAAASAAPAAPAPRAESYTVASITGRASRQDGSNGYVIIRAGEILPEDTVVRIDSGSLVLTKDGKTFTLPSGRMGKIADLIARL